MTGEAGAAVTLGHLHRVESALARLLEDMVRNHEQDTEIRHVAIDLLRWSSRHLVEIERIARVREVPFDAPANNGLITSATLAPEGRTGPLVLLDDLIRLSCTATEAVGAWVLTAQVAAARRDTEVQALVQHCQSDTRRQLRWADATLSTLAAQALLSL